MQLEKIERATLSRAIEVVKQAERDLLLVSPYLSLKVVATLLDSVNLRSGRIRLVTDLAECQQMISPHELHAILTAFQNTADSLKARFELFSCRYLHAKLIVADTGPVLVGSANLTEKAFVSNLEIWAYVNLGPNAMQTIEANLAPALCPEMNRVVREDLAKLQDAKSDRVWHGRKVDSFTSKLTGLDRRAPPNTFEFVRFETFDQRLILCVTTESKLTAWRAFHDKILEHRIDKRSAKTLSVGRDLAFKLPQADQPEARTWNIAKARVVRRKQGVEVCITLPTDEVLKKVEGKLAAKYLQMKHNYARRAGVSHDQGVHLDTATRELRLFLSSVQEAQDLAWFAVSSYRLRRQFGLRS